MPKPEQTDALEEGGPGVGVQKDKKLDALADKFSELVEERAGVSENITKVEGQIIDRMKEIGVKVYKYADRVVKIKDGKAHVKIKTVKAEEPK